MEVKHILNICSGVFKRLITFASKLRRFHVKAALKHVVLKQRPPTVFRPQIGSLLDNILTDWPV